MKKINKLVINLKIWEIDKIIAMFQIPLLIVKILKEVIYVIKANLFKNKSLNKVLMIAKVNIKIAFINNNWI